jgi:hypothetical protein
MFPVYVDLKKHKNERQAFVEFIKSNSRLNQNNNVYIFDRGFYSSELVAFLNDNNMMYLFRTSAKLKINKAKNTDDYLVDLENKNKLRVVKYEINNTKYYLATNLVDDVKYTTDFFKETYHKRWYIEEYFKYLKSNYKFEYFNEKKEENIQKSIYGCLINSFIISSIIKLARKFKIINDDENIVKSQLTQGLYLIYKKLFLGKIGLPDLKCIFIDNIKIKSKNRKSNVFDRVAKSTNHKWSHRRIKSSSLNITHVKELLEKISNNSPSFKTKCINVIKVFFKI